eukprot:s3850_g1.t1
MADMTQQERTSDALKQVRDIFSEMDEDAARMEVDQAIQGKRGHASPTRGSLKAPRLAGKGRGQDCSGGMAYYTAQQVAGYPGYANAAVEANALGLGEVVGALNLKLSLA